MNAPEVEEVDADEWEGVRWVDVLYRWKVEQLRWPCSLGLRVFSGGRVTVMGVCSPKLEYIPEMERVATEHARAHVLPRLQAEATETP